MLRSSEMFKPYLVHRLVLPSFPHIHSRFLLLGGSAHRQSDGVNVEAEEDELL